MYFDSKKKKRILGNQIMLSLSLLFFIFHYFVLTFYYLCLLFCIVHYFALKPCFKILSPCLSKHLSTLSKACTLFKLYDNF